MGAIANKAAENKALAQKASKPVTMQDYVNKYHAQISAALPKVGITPERFTRLVLSALSTTPDLAQCEPKSFLGAMMTCAQMGMEPNTPLGQAYLIPYNNRRKGIKECQYQLGYKGLIELAHRSGQVQTIFAEEVCENDEFTYELGVDAKLIHKPRLDGPRGNVTCYYAVWKGTDGGYGFAVMSRDDIIRHRNLFSKAQNSPWDTNFDEMAKKTVLKKALKYAPLSIDFQREIAADEMIKQPNENELELGGDMLDMNGEYVEAEGTVQGDADDSGFDADASFEIDQETGEVK